MARRKKRYQKHVIPDKPSDLIQTWLEIGILVAQIDCDIYRSEKGNLSAGVRIRRALRLLKKWPAELIKRSFKHDDMMRKIRIKNENKKSANLFKKKDK